VFEQIPTYGEKKVHQQLLEDGFKVSLNTVARYRQALVNQLVVKGNFIAPFFLIGAGYNGHVFIRSIKRLTKTCTRKK
jgi:hypothetical protein